MSVSNMPKYVLWAMLLLCSATLSYGQKTKSQLEKEKRENLSKIAEAEKILSDTESERKATIGQLRALNQQISAREGLISSLNEEIALLDGEIADLNIIVSALLFFFISFFFFRNNGCSVIVVGNFVNAGF